MRDRLIELLDECRCMEGIGAELIEKQADHLLANGVIVPPCKVGDIIYALTYDRKYYMPLKVTRRESLVRWMDEYQFGNTLFVTRKEAEQALKG